MKISLALLIVALGASVPGATVSASQHGSDAALISGSTELSAAKKKRHRVYVYGAPPYGYYHAYPPAFSVGDPSYQSPEQIRLRSLNRCFFDLGYGRWKNCN
jgi:hypothetical protein